MRDKKNKKDKKSRIEPVGVILDKRKCDCCGQEVEVDNINVCASAMGPISYAYCNSCLVNGIEPYEGIIAYCAGAVESYEKLTSPTYKQIIDTNLKFYGKTVEQFNADLAENNRRMYEGYSQQYNREGNK
jgi:hypothetical protein